MNLIARILLTSAVVICASAAWAQSPVDTEQIVLTVNGQPVHASEIRLAMGNVAAQLRQQGRELESDELFQAATDQVVTARLLAQEARRREISLEADYVDSVLHQIEEQQGGRDALEATLSGVGAGYDDLEIAVEESGLAQQLVETQIRPSVVVSDDEVKAFYEENPAMFQTPEQVWARHILFRVAEDASEDQRTSARGRAELARQRAVSREDFAALAKELSEGPSADKGGDLGFFSAGQMVTPFSDAAFALEPGEVSGVVETQFGYHVIKVEERRAGEVRLLDEVREGLRNALQEREVATALGTLIEQLRSAAEIVPAEAPPVADAG